MSQTYAIRWTRPDPVKGTIEGWRVCDEPPTPSAPMLFDDSQQARDVCAVLNEQSAVYSYSVVRVK